jgi:glycosyltransferase involved in cell wall biosynthesis
MTSTAAPVRVFLPCTGLGRVQRGFEAFTRECGRVLAADRRLDVTVFGGGGDLLPDERDTWNLPRDQAAARLVGTVIGYDAYFVEQMSFFAGFVTALALQKPDVVYFGDINLGNACWHWRRVTRQRFRLLYYNGGATTRPFTRCDAVQQVSPEHLDAAIARGESPGRQLLLPHGVHMTRELHAASADERARTRSALGVPADRPVVLSVGALGTSIKRLDAVIAEVATMPSEPHLLLLGADTPESGLVRTMAAERLPGRCTILTVSRERARAAYRAADAFVLASLREGFGLAMVEALDAGLPCVAHDTPTMAYLMGPYGARGDLTFGGTLATLLERALAEGPARAAARHQHAYEHFSWDVLAPRYAEMLIACAAGRAPGGPAR